MKRLLQVIFSFVLMSDALSQQRPHYTQYILNNYILNPALTGIENYTDIKISTRDQWVGLNGAPRTMYLTVHTPLGKKDYKSGATSFAVPGENPRGTSYWQNYTASSPHHGAGISIINDRTGLYNRFSANFSYAYHIGLSVRTNMSFGFAGGIQKISRDIVKTDFGDQEPDNAQGSIDDIYKIRPDLSTGVWVYSGEYFIGIGAQQVIPQKVSFVDDTLGFKLVPHLFGTAGYRFLLNEDINAIPSMMIKYIHPLKPQFDFNLKIQYRDLLWMGGSYRMGYGYSGMIGLNIGNTANFGYAYDFTKTPLSTVSKGTHEIVLGFLLGNHYGDTCPRNVW